MSDIAQWLTAMAVVLVASAVQGLTGFGFAILAVPLLALVEDPHKAVAICMVLSVISVLGMWWVTRYQERLPIGGRLFGVALFGLPMGVLALGQLRADWLKLGAGLATLAATGIVAHLTFRRRRHDESAREAKTSQSRAIVLTGLLSGFLAGCLSMPGPPVVALLSGSDVQKTAYRATLLTYFALIYPAASIVMAASGIIGQYDVLISLSYIPALWLGAVIGNFLHHRIRQSAFTIASLLLLTASGLACVWTAAASITRSG